MVFGFLFQLLVSLIGGRLHGSGSLHNVTKMHKIERGRERLIQIDGRAKRGKKTRNFKGNDTDGMQLVSFSKSGQLVLIYFGGRFTSPHLLILNYVYDICTYISLIIIHNRILYSLIIIMLIK